MFTVTIPSRLDAFLVSQGVFLSRNKAQKAIEDGLVFVNDDIIEKPAYQLAEGDEVTVTVSDVIETSSVIKPVDLSLEVLYEDNACFVIHKPAGIAVHPGAGIGPDEPTILHGIAHLFAERALPFSAASVLVHRLDRETTGCLLIAKSADAHIALQKQFESRTVEKMYLAVVAGAPSPASAMIDAPISRSPVQRTKMSVLGVASSARPAKTTYRTLATNAGKTVALLECDLHTGRTHQIRVHLQAIGHPILGDDTYTTTASDRLSKELQVQNLCLHARMIQFVSPADKGMHCIEAPVPETLRNALRNARIDYEVL
jgi:23S rRNA pseudouridine1911/1915/1917 synthase